MPRVPKTILLQDFDSTKEIWVNKKKLLSARSLAFLNKSPTGFSWGYGGSGPAQLAFAIFLKYLPAREVMAMHQALNWKFKATLPQTDFETVIPFDEPTGFPLPLQNVVPCSEILEMSQQPGQVARDAPAVAPAFCSMGHQYPQVRSD